MFFPGKYYFYLPVKHILVNMKAKRYFSFLLFSHLENLPKTNLEKLGKYFVFPAYVKIDTNKNIH